MRRLCFFVGSDVSGVFYRDIDLGILLNGADHRIDRSYVARDVAVQVDSPAGLAKLICY